jgi:hypothetical protein
MSALPGKVQVLGTTQIKDNKVFVLQMIQGRNPEWVLRPFFAAFDDQAIWLDELRPAFDQSRFFYQDELDMLMESSMFSEGVA